MRRSPSTVVCVCGDGAAPTADELGAAANVIRVSAAVTSPATPADVPSFLETTTRMYDRAASGHAPYVVVDVDPLSPARDAWRRRYEEQTDVFEEFAAAVRLRPVELPDYYLLLAEPRPSYDLEWYGGLLRELRPSRVLVVPTDADPPEVARRAKEALSQLPAGPWWPSVGEVIDSARHFVPRAPNAGPR